MILNYILLIIFAILVTSFMTSFYIVCITTPITYLFAYIYNFKINLKSLIFTGIVYAWLLHIPVVFLLIAYTPFHFKGAKDPYLWLAVLVGIVLQLIFNYIIYKQDSLIEERKANTEHHPYIQKSWSDSSEIFSKHFILSVISEIQIIDDANSVFWVTIIDGDESTLEVRKDLTVVAKVQNDLKYILIRKTKGWQEVEFLLKLFLSKQFKELKNKMKENNA